MRILVMVFTVCAPLLFAGCASDRGAAVEVQETDKGAVQSAPQTLNPETRPVPVPSPGTDAPLR